MNDIETSKLDLLRLDILRLQLTLGAEAVVFLTRQESLQAELGKAQMAAAALELAEDAE
jgi:hypothetical protein